MIAPGEQCGTARRAQRRRMEAGIPQSRLRDSVQIRRRDLPTEGAPCPEATVVDEDDEHVGRTLRRGDDRDLVHHRVLVGAFDLALEGLLGARQNVLRDRTPRPQEAHCRNQQGRASALYVVHDVLLRSYSTASRWRVARRSRVVKKGSRNTTSPDRARGARSAVSLRRDREPGLVLWIEVSRTLAVDPVTGQASR